MALRWTLGRDRHAHRRAVLLRPRRAAGPALRCRSSDSLSQAPGGCGHPPGRVHPRSSDLPGEALVIDFRMPSLGADMEKGTVVEWLKKPGDRVARGEVVAVAETQKGAVEVEVFDEGVLKEILVAVGTEVPVGAVPARIEGHAAMATPAAELAPPPMPLPRPVQVSPPAVTPPRP